MRFFKKISKIINAGFTLIELLVVVAIISILSALVLYNYRTFGDKVLISNLAYDIGISVREAQNYGLAARDSTGTVSFGKYYGISFGPQQTTGTDTHYLLFFDLNGDQKYTGTSAGLGSCPPGSPSVADECVKVFILTNGLKITKVCVVGTGLGGSDVCTPNMGVFTSTPSDPRFLNILFKRPNPDANIYDYQSSPINPYHTETNPVRIEVSNSSGTVKKSVVVSVTGQISVQ